MYWAMPRMTAKKVRPTAEQSGILWISPIHRRNSELLWLCSSFFKNEANGWLRRERVFNK
ncbi:hypothetical protein PspKH34_19910 [Parageobacillus sp. KH3-4]|nr:hypothetical protein PspKH34_19910 [Parageobacillus sp. KH3-4]